MSLVGTERTLNSLGPVVAAELSSDVNRLLREHLEDLFVVGGPGVTAVGRSVSQQAQSRRMFTTTVLE